MKEAKSLLIAAACLAGLAVAIGAFGAHGLKTILEANHRTDTFETAVKYHFYHALAMLLVGVLARTTNNPKLVKPGWLFLAGTGVFSGTLYALSLTNIKILGAITPIGGVLYLIGWFWLALLMAKTLKD